MSLTSVYKNTPIAGIFGAGNFLYSCVLDTSIVGVKKYSIYANNVNEAMYIVGCQLGNILSYSYISNEVMSLILDGYTDGTCILYEG